MSFKTTDGERLTKTFIDGQIRKAKQEFLKQCEHSDIAYCQACGASNKRLSCSHIISVNDCQNDGRSEIAFDVENLQLECYGENGCHEETERGTIDHHANARYKKDFIEKYYEKR